MEAIRQWFQDWSDACEYARECAPDFASFPHPIVGEPYTALLAIAAGCFLIWAWNERRIRSLPLRRALATDGGAEELSLVFEQMKREPAAAAKKRAA